MNEITSVLGSTREVPAAIGEAIQGRSGAAEWEGKLCFGACGGWANLLSWYPIKERLSQERWGAAGVDAVAAKKTGCGEECGGRAILLEIQSPVQEFP